MLSSDTTSAKSSSGKKWLPGRFQLWLLIPILVVITALPIANIIWTLATTGADSLSNDYLAYVGIVDQVLSGSYNWSHFFADTFYRTHSVTLPVLLHILDARLFHWSIYPELYFGIALAVIRLVLWQQTLSAGISGRLSYLLWPLLSFLVFSNSQMSVFAFGDATIPIGLALLGFSLGTWSLVRLKNRPAAALSLMVIGGLIGSYSWANGLVSWVVFLAGLAMLEYRKTWHYLVWAAGLIVALLPYVFFLAVSHLGSAHSAYPGTSVVSILNLRFIINALGWPFANGIARGAERLADAQLIAWAGLALAAAGTFLLFRQAGRSSWRSLAPSILFALYGLLSIWQISMFRVLIAPWYTALAIPYWSGLLGLVAVIASSTQASSDSSARTQNIFKRTWIGATLLLVVVAYLHSNLTYDDKTTALSVRSPASASMLRNYATAPTYGELNLFEWGGGYPDMLPRLAKPLQKHSLSVFDPKQEWSLQGDFGLNTVSFSKSTTPSDVIWIAGTASADRYPWNDYKHLNLSMHAPDSISWTVQLPSNLKTAAFETSSQTGRPVPENAKAPGTICRVTLSTTGNKSINSISQLVRNGDKNWHKIGFPLKDYAGQSVTITLSVASFPGSTSPPAVFQYPHIDLVLSKPLNAEATASIRPSNTDLSPVPVLPQAGDPRLDTHSPGAPADFNPDEFSDFWITVSEVPKVSPRAVAVSLSVTGRSQPLSFVIPLLADAAVHTYTYPLRLLNFDASDRISGIKTGPLNTSAPARETDILGYGLIRRGK